jgi:Rrf2 family protein
MFSATAEYALRAMVLLADLPPGRSLSGGEISRRAGVPQNYLSKILYALKNAGFLETARGTGGGYRLRLPAGRILLVDITAVFDGSRARLGCILGKELACSDDRPCSVHSRWKEIRSGYMAFMEETTLAQVAGDLPAACRAPGEATARPERAALKRRKPASRGRMP